MSLALWLLRRGLGWLLLLAGGLVALGLLVDTLELGARHDGAAWADLLSLALLASPLRLVQLSPALLALASGITVLGLRRSGEWEGLGIAGLTPSRRLRPLLLLGYLAALAGLGIQECLVPPASLEGARRLARVEGRPDLHPETSGAWLHVPGVFANFAGFEPPGLDPSPGLVDVRAWCVEGGQLTAAWSAESLRWSGAFWEPVGGVKVQPWAPSVSLDAPWSRLPPPEDLRSLVVAQGPSARGALLLWRHPTPEARVELWTRLLRLLVLGPVCFLGGAMALLASASSWALLLSLAPVLLTEGAALCGRLAFADIAPSMTALPGLLVALGLLLGLRRRIDGA